MTDKAPAAPIEPPAAVSLRRVEELIRYHKGRHTPWTPITADTATALEALVKLVEAGFAEIYCADCPDTAAALAQFVDDRGHDPDHREKKP